MKRNSYNDFVEIIIFSFLLFNSISFAQQDCVELRDENGILINIFPCIQNACSAIPNPISQPYFIEILPSYISSYDPHPIQIFELEGSSEINTITLRPSLDNYNETIYGSDQIAINLNGADYFIIDGRPGGIDTTGFLRIGTNSFNSSAIAIVNGSSHNIIKNCIITNYEQLGYDGSSSISIFGSTSACDSNLLENCQIVGGKRGILLQGQSINILNSGNVISNCKIYNFREYGIYLINSKNTTVQSCMFYHTISTSLYNQVVGIYVTSNGTYGENYIVRNKIYNLRQLSSLPNSSVRGIFIIPSQGSQTSIVNNFISLTLNNNDITMAIGIDIGGSNNGQVNIYYNTILMSGNQPGGNLGTIMSAAIQKANSGASTIYNQINNICINNRTSGSSVYNVGSNIANVSGSLNINFNCYFSDAGPNSYHAAWDGTVYDDLNLYRAAANPNEKNTIFKNVMFVSSTNLHLDSLSIGDFDLAGIPIASITDDIDGDIRHTVFPYKGADEAIPLPVEFVSFSAIINGSSVLLNWTTATEMNNSGFIIERNKTVSEWQQVGFVPGSGTTTEPKTYSFTDVELSPGNYYYRIKQIDFNGSYTYYELGYAIEIVLPDKFELAQNYPNPFNPTTKIEYSVAKETNVQLIVFNSIGEEVSLLVNETQQKGKYSVNFDAFSLSSGVYFYKLLAGDFISIKKMLLLK